MGVNQCDIVSCDPVQPLLLAKSCAPAHSYTAFVNKTADEMAEAASSNVKKKTKEHVDNSFVIQSEEELAQLLQESKAKNTNRSTNTAMRRFRAYLEFMNLDPPEEIADVDLLKILNASIPAFAQKRMVNCIKLEDLKC